MRAGINEHHLVVASELGAFPFTVLDHVIGEVQESQLAAAFG